jgi:nicotinamidase-related amidase
VGSEDFVAPEWERSALLLIDVQSDFIEGPWAVAGTAEKLAVMARLAAAFRAAGRPIVHVVRFYEPGGDDVDLPRRALILAGEYIAAPGTDGSQIPVELLPRQVLLEPESLRNLNFQQVGQHEHIMFKPRWSAFYRTRLDQHLRDRDVTTVVVAGCNLPNCPRATLFDASERDYRAVLVHDATSQVTDARLQDLALIGVTVTDAAAAQLQLGGHEPQPQT